MRQQTVAQSRSRARTVGTHVAVSYVRQLGWNFVAQTQGGLKYALDDSSNSSRALASRDDRAHRRRVDSPSARRGARRLLDQSSDGASDRLAQGADDGASGIPVGVKLRTPPSYA